MSLGLGAASAEARCGRALLYLGDFEQYDEWKTQFFSELAYAAHTRQREEVQQTLEDLFGGKAPDEPVDLSLLTIALEAAVLIEDADWARRLLAFIPGELPLVMGPGNYTCVARNVGGAYALLSEKEKARSSYEEAVDGCAKAGFRPDHALSRLGLAEVLLDHYPDEHDAAIRHLDFAIAEFQEMKMRPALERALGRRGLLKA
jgi:hypothetical protein